MSDVMVDDGRQRGLRAALEQQCLSGLLEAADALAGGDPEAVCSAFATWRDEAWRGWPWLAGLCWSSLEPLGLSFPTDDPAAVTAGRLLVGAETDAEVLREALDALREHVGDQPAWEPLPATGADLTGELRRRSLVSAVGQFWGELVGAMRRLHEPVVLRDRHRADTLIVGARRQLEETADRLDLLVERVLTAPAPVMPPPEAEPEPEPEPEPESEPEPEPEPEPERAPEPPPPAPEPTASPEWSPPEPPVEVEEEDEGPPTEPIPVIEQAPPPEPEVVTTRPHPPMVPPRAAPIEEEPAYADEATPASAGSFSEDDEDVEYVSVRERRYAPVIFLIGVTVGALYWIFHIISNGF